MRFSFGMAFVVSALGAVVACSSSGGGTSPQNDAGTACTDTITNIFNNNVDSNGNSLVRCPVDSSGNTLNYDQAITTTCSTEKLKTGVIQYGQCLDYLVWQVQTDAAGKSFSKCFYDVVHHKLVGVIYSDGMQDQCNNTSATVQGGTVEQCDISGTSAGAGGGYEPCAPMPDAGTDSAAPADAGGQ